MKTERAYIIVECIKDLILEQIDPKLSPVINATLYKKGNFYMGYVQGTSVYLENEIDKVFSAATPDARVNGDITDATYLKTFKKYFKIKPVAVKDSATTNTLKKLNQLY